MLPINIILSSLAYLGGTYALLTLIFSTSGSFVPLSGDVRKKRLWLAIGIVVACFAAKLVYYTLKHIDYDIIVYNYLDLVILLVCF